MPNWIEGNMKVRGRAKDVFKFFSESFEKYNGKFINGDNGIPEYVQEVDESAVKIDMREDMECEIYISDYCYIKGTRRAFSNKDSYIFFDDVSTEKEVTKVISVKQAWGWMEENYKKLSDKYDIDIRLIGWECGMEYKGECEVLRGQDPVYIETTYDDWTWETECPTMGG